MNDNIIIVENTTLYQATVYFNKKMIRVLVYKNYEHFLSDLTNGSVELFYGIPDELFENTEFDRPKIFSGCTDSQDYSTDFDFTYGNGILVHCGELLTRD